ASCPRSKPAAHPPPLALEALEDLTVPSAMPGAVAAVSALLPSGPAITAPLAPGGAPAGGALLAPGGIPAQVSSSHSLQAPLPVPSKVLSTLASIPAQVSSSRSPQAPLPAPSSTLSGIAGSATVNTAQQLNRIVTSVTGDLNNAASTLQALSSTQSGTTATATGDATAQLARVMTDVAGSMRTVLSSLNALV